MCGLTCSQLVICLIHNSRIYNWLHDRKFMSQLRENEDIFAYEVMTPQQAKEQMKEELENRNRNGDEKENRVLEDGEEERIIYLQVLHRKIDKTGKVFFGVPHVISVPERHTTNRQLVTNIRGHMLTAFFKTNPLLQQDEQKEKTEDEDYEEEQNENEKEKKAEIGEEDERKKKRE